MQEKEQGKAPRFFLQGKAPRFFLQGCQQECKKKSVQSTLFVSYLEFTVSNEEVGKVKHFLSTQALFEHAGKVKGFICGFVKENG